jgi:hypothetical protein
MQATAAATSAAAADRLLDRYVVRPAGVLAELLGAAELGEDELLLRLREIGLITYPSPLLGGLLEKLPEVLEAEVLTQLEPSDLALVARVGRASRAAVVASGLPHAGPTGGVPLKIKDFIGSVELLAWAKENGCPWVVRTCAVIARHGHQQVLRRARELDCPWGESTCAATAEGGHLDVLVWAREHGCQWDEETCDLAVEGGHLEVLRWAIEHGCPGGEEYEHHLTGAEVGAGAPLPVG